MRLGWVLVGAVALAACGSESATSDAAQRACELLASEKDLPVPPPAMDTTARSIGSSFVEYLDDSGSNATVYVAVDHVDELENVAHAVDELDGIEIVAVLDQEAAYEEFEEIFPDNPELIATVDPSLLPASVQVRADTDADLDDLADWAGGDSRVQGVIDARETGVVILKTVARSFAAELEELESITNGEMRSAIRTIRSTDEPGLDDISTTFDAVSSYIADNCGD